MRHQLAAERLGEDGGFEPVEQRPGAGGFGFEAIGAAEGGIYFRDNPILHLKGRKPKAHL